MSKKEELNNSYEKLREELFSYRVDIKAYMKSLNIIIISGTIILSLLAFFGYNKIENIQKIALEKVERRLAITDSLLAKIDQNKIDSLKSLLDKKEKEFQNTIKRFDEIIIKNKELENKLLLSLSVNPKINPNINSYISEQQVDFFDIKPFKHQLKIGEQINIFIIFNSKINLDDIEFLGIKLYPKGRNILLQDRYYSINSRLNKIIFRISNKFKNYNNYSLEIGFYKKEKGKYKFYHTTENITLI